MTDLAKKKDQLTQQTAEIDRMMNDQKGALLLESVRNVAIHAGTDENEYIALLVHHSGILDGITSAMVNWDDTKDGIARIEAVAEALTTN